MNVVLGPPFEAIIGRIIEKGYAGNQTEVIRQALLFYDKYLDEEEFRLVYKGIESEMNEIKAGQVKTKSLAQIKKKLKV